MKLGLLWIQNLFQIIYIFVNFKNPYCFENCLQYTMNTEIPNHLEDSKSYIPKFRNSYLFWKLWLFWPYRQTAPSPSSKMDTPPELIFWMFQMILSKNKICLVQKKMVIFHQGHPKRMWTSILRKVYVVFLSYGAVSLQFRPCGALFFAPAVKRIKKMYSKNLLHKKIAQNHPKIEQIDSRGVSIFEEGGGPVCR